MKTQVCPGCLARVLLRSDDTCPACGARVDPKAKPPTRRRVTLREAESLPPLCHRCGEPTDQRLVLESTRTVGGEHPVMAALAIVGMLLQPRAAFRVGRKGGLGLRGETTSTTHRIPTCPTCAKERPPRAEHVEHSSGEVVVLVHRKFEKALSSARAQRTRAE